MFVRNDWANADAEIELRVKSGWLSKEEGHRLKTLLKMGETPERTVTEEFLSQTLCRCSFFFAYKIRKLKGLDVQILRHCLTFFSSAKHFFSIIFMYYSTYYYSVLFSTYIILLNYIMILSLLLCFV